MSYEKIPLGNNVQGMTSSPIFDKYSRVIVKNGDDSYVAGTDSGRTLEVECPYATQAMAESILSQVEGFAYQPYEATSAYLDPAAEMGDGINAKNIYSGVYKYKIDFNRIMPWDLSADSDEELEHEFGFLTDEGRYVTYSGLANGSVAVNGAGLVGGSVSTDKVSPGINSALGYADYANGVWNGWNSPANCLAGNLGSRNASVASNLLSARSQFTLEGYDISRKTITVNGSRYYVLGWQDSE